MKLETTPNWRALVWEWNDGRDDWGSIDDAEPVDLPGIRPCDVALHYVREAHKHNPPAVAGEVHVDLWDRNNTKHSVAVRYAMEWAYDAEYEPQPNGEQY